MAGNVIIESQPAAVAAYPETVAAVNEQTADHIIGERGRVLRVVIVAGEGRGGRVEARETAANCADPDEAFAVASQAEDAIAADGGRIGWVMAEILTRRWFHRRHRARRHRFQRRGGRSRFRKAADFGMGEAGRVERVGQEAHEILAVEIELADAAVGADPEDLVRREQKSQHPIIGER